MKISVSDLVDSEGHSRAILNYSYQSVSKLNPAAGMGAAC